jgi:hypothetical protein
MGWIKVIARRSRKEIFTRRSPEQLGAAKETDLTGKALKP